MEQKSIFISHSTRNDDQVDRIADALESAGFQVWVDHRNGITPGTPSWDKAIRQAIEDADTGLFIMSEAALASDICGSECLLVRELGDPLYVLKLEDVKPASVWLYIKQIQYADLTHDFDAGMGLLIRTLHGETDKNAPQALRSKFTGESVLRQYLPFLFLNPLRGRDDDLRRLTESLNGVVQVTGTGGLGKSRLVAEAALKHPEGAVWHRCSPLSSPGDLLGTLMDHLRLAKDSTEQDVLNELQLRPRTLIVIDNAEAVKPERQALYAAFIASLQASGAHVVLTSRVRWEQLRPLKEITPTALDLPSAAAIAHDFAMAQQIPLTDTEAEAIAQAARLHPRLIEWAIGQMGKRPFERVLTQLRELKSRAVQEALDEMIRSSLQQMNEQEGDHAQRLLLRLVVCDGTFDYAAIVALKPEEMDEDALDDALDVLQAWRFVRYERSEERYSVDAMVRLALPAPDETASRLHFAHFHALHSDDDANNDEDTHRHIALDWDNIQVALNWGFDHEVEKAVDWTDALQYFMALRRNNQERLVLLTRALQLARNVAYPTGEANCLHSLGDVHLQMSEYTTAFGWFEQALAIYREIGDLKGEANCRNAQGVIHHMRHMYAEAVQAFRQALTLYEKIGNQVGEASCLDALGNIHRMKSEYVEAVELSKRALTLNRMIGDRLGEANCLQALGDVHRMKDEHGEALELFTDALAVYIMVGAQFGEANCLAAIGDVYLQKNQFTEAMEKFERALELYRIKGVRQGQAFCLHAMGDVHRMKSEKVNAMKCYDQALSLYRTIGDRQGEALCLQSLGKIPQSKDT